MAHLLLHFGVQFDLNAQSGRLRIVDLLQQLAPLEVCLRQLGPQAFHFLETDVHRPHLNTTKGVRPGRNSAKHIHGCIRREGAAEAAPQAVG